MRMASHFILLSALLQIALCETSFRISVDASDESHPLPKFWASTGFSPPKSDRSSVKEYLLSKDVKINLAHICSLPRSGIQLVRVHWLLSLLSENEDGSINWADLDEIIDTIVQCGLKPVIEFMGNSTLLKPTKGGIRNFWKTLVSTLISRYKDRYGKKEVLRWKFETWNEPDLAMYNVFKFSLDEYLEYVDGCIEGAISVFPRIQIGGPAGLFKDISRHPLCWGFLDHCNASKSRCNLKYLSFHKKGNGTTSGILNGTLEVIETLKRDYYNLSRLKIVNDESDILTGWWKQEEYRGDVRYAAAVLRTVALFKKHLKESNIERISFDNGFINEPPIFFDQRTLLTRFISNNGNISFVQKPVYAVMGLLAMLGEEELPVNTNTDERFSIIATRSKKTLKNEILSLSILIGLSYDDLRINSSEILLNTKFILPEEWTNNALYVVYKLENELPHPKKIWEEAGKPVNPGKELLAELQRYQEPHKILHGRVRSGELKIKLKLGQPSITFIQICSQKSDKLRKISHLRAFNMSFNEVFLTWKDPPINGRCIKTYSIEHSPKIDGPFLRINEKDVIFNSYNFIFLNSSYQGNEKGEREYTLGFYKVAAVDFWGKRGRYSDTLKYGL